ncbi:MAG: transposase [Proteobacteria bacterium]|nr:transposase [Pseudomonadota bacterium]MDE3208620.1 transposase [Pseudomonadota bacterium]
MLESICRGTAVKWECEVPEFNGEADHVYLLRALTPKAPSLAFVDNLKMVPVAAQGVLQSPETVLLE